VIQTTENLVPSVNYYDVDELSLTMDTAGYLLQSILVYLHRPI